MFGLEDQQKKKKVPEFVYELEKEFKDPKICQKIQKNIDAKVQSIKNVLRAGAEQEDFETFGLLLHGYISLMKVMARCKK
jgi:hypothetical protein